MSIIDEIKKQVPYEEVLNQFNLDTSTPPDITIDRLAPNNYLTIVWKDTITNSIYNTYEDLAVDNNVLVQYTTSLNNAINNALNNTNSSALIGNNKYINVESIAKYLSQNIIPSGVKRDIVNAIIGLLTGSKSSLSSSAVNLMVNVFGDISKKVAKAIGFSDPHEAFASIVSENSLAFLNVLGKKTKDKLVDFASNKLNLPINKIKSKTGISSNVQYVGLLLGLTTSDTESYEITIPRRKVENGSNYTTHLLPQPFKKEFNVKLTNKVLSSVYDYEQEIDNIEKVKNKLIEISQSHTTFDIYIRLSNGHMYKKSNVVFSSISFQKDEGSGNGYECTFTIEPIEEFYTKTFISDRKYFPTISSGNNGTGTSSGTRKSGSSKGAGKSGKNKNVANKNGNGGPMTYRTDLGWGKDAIVKDSEVYNVKDAREITQIMNSNYRTGAPFNTVQYIQKGKNDTNFPDFDAIPDKNFVKTVEGYYVPKVYTEFVKGYYSGPNRYKLAEGVTAHKDGTFTTKGGRRFKVYQDAGTIQVTSSKAKNKVTTKSSSTSTPIYIGNERVN